ncbi:MAG: T9SS type A sorting domain-containing protein [Candidatus Cloacimonetes bacterium]|nr:T9SS type A sorting domain-containing protein [Candidatus Cloacimonadota bacterium]
MKKTLLVVLCLSFLFGTIFAKEMIPGINKKPVTLPQGIPLLSNRTAPEYIFTKNPTAVITSYYDYMIGSYNGLPLRTIPQSAGGGYFMTYHGSRSSTGQRRAFYTYLDAQGNVINNNEITAVVNREGYPTVAVDPVSGKPLYAWHANTDADDENEVQFTSDGFIAGIAGLFNNLQVIAQNPITITPGVGTPTTDNEFLWPTAQIGPSPVDGKRRVYVICRNFVTHSFGPSENPYIAYADFDGDDIETGVPLVWSSTTIPEMDQWNHDAEWRRPFHAITTDEAGNVYYAGYHFATEADGTTDIPEADMDIFKCTNYGQGEWTRISAYSTLPAWNPPATPTGTAGYFTNDSDVPYTDEQLKWSISNSSHLNATVDDAGRIHVPCLWALSNDEGFYYPVMQFAKEFVFDPQAAAGEQFTIKEIYPQVNPQNTHDEWFQPWDMVAPWGEVDSWTEYSTGWAPDIADDWNFPYWDQAAHGDAMFFHYSNMKVTEGNDNGMLAMVWQNCVRAKWNNADGDTDYAAWANTPEIFISVSPNNGGMWSEPIKLNNIETTPQFTGLKPMWVYPADKVIFTGMQGENKVGKLGIMFYDDFTWGSNAIENPVHPTADGGQVMFTELQIVFPTGHANEDNSVIPVTNLLAQNYPNPFNPETTISFDMPKAAPATLAVYNVKGQLVKNLFNGTAAFGKNSVVWNGTDNNGTKVTSGLYFYRLSTDSKVETRKMMLMK